MIENEFKLMLTAKQYEKISAELSWDKTIVQTNHYYDTEELDFSSAHITVRVREIEGKFFLQIKLPADRECSRIELETPIDGIPEKISGERLKALCGRELPDARLLGGLLTVRKVSAFNGGEIDLDKSEYFGKTDFELEIEFSDEKAARGMFAKICELVGAKPEGVVCEGKVRRFLKELARRG